MDLDNIKTSKLRLFHRPKHPRLHLLGYLLSRFLGLTTYLKIDLMTIFSGHLVMLELFQLVKEIFIRDRLKDELTRSHPKGILFAKGVASFQGLELFANLLSSDFFLF